MVNVLSQADEQFAVWGLDVGIRLLTQCFNLVFVLEL